MEISLQVLLIEDSASDAELILAELRKHGYEPNCQRVQTADAFRSALDQRTWEVILSDYTLAEFSALAALEIVQDRKLDVPFIVVSSTIGEELAVAVMKAGALNHVSKQQLTRLGSVVEWELFDANMRREKLRTEQAQRKLRQKKQLAEKQVRDQARLLDLTRDAIIVADLEDRISYWNKGATGLYGWAAEEVIGVKLAELLSKEASALDSARTAVVENGEWRGELQQFSKAGKGVVVSSRWTLVREEGGEAKSILLINTDITETKELEAQFLHAQRMESIGTLASGIAHDLNNVLAPILMATQMLRTRSLDPESQRLVSVAEDNARRGVDVLAQLLSFARKADSGRVLINPKHVIREIVRVAKRTFPDSIRVQSEVAADLWTLTGHPTQLQQVLLNLCINARDAMAEGGTLAVSASNTLLDEMYARMRPEAKPGPYVKTCVSDTGMGMRPEIMDKIFDPFFTTKPPGQGTGLGLSSALGIVKAHGGFLEVQSVVGIGSTFAIYLPATPAQEITEPKSVESALPPGQGELILIAEDSADLRETTQQMLSSHGYQVLVAADGTEAIVLFSRHLGTIRLLLTDILMPFLGGVDLIRAVKKMAPQVKVVAYSGGDLSDPRRAEELKALEVQAVLAKPYTAEQLLSTLHQVLYEPVEENPTTA